MRYKPKYNLAVSEVFPEWVLIDPIPILLPYTSLNMLVPIHESERPG